MTTKARLDADRTAKKEAADALLRGRGVTVTSPLLAAVRSALLAIGNSTPLRSDAERRVWLDSLYVESDADAYYVMRERPIAGGAHSDQLGGGFYRRSRGDAWAMRQAASALVREWVREQLDAWVQDDGKGE